MTDFSIRNLNFALQFTSGAAYVAFHMAASTHTDCDALMDKFALYMRQPSHRFDFHLKPYSDNQFHVNAEMTFDYAEFEDGPLHAHTDMVNTEGPLVLDGPNVAMFVYALCRDALLTQRTNPAAPFDPQNMIPFAFAAHMIKQMQGNMTPPFLTYTHTLLNDVWSGTEFGSARADFEKNLLTNLDAIRQEDMPNITDDDFDILTSQHGARQFLCVSVVDPQTDAYLHSILACRADKTEAIVEADSFSSAMNIMTYLERAYILPELLGPKAGRTAQFVAQKNNLLHISNWNSHAITKPALSLLGPRPS